MRLLLIALLLSPAALAGTTYYASPSGNSANSGTRLAPFDLSTLLSYGSNQNTLILLSGTYPGNYYQNPIANCTIAADVRYGSVIANGTNATGINFELGLGGSNVFVTGLIASNSLAFGFECNGSGITFDHCIAISNYASGFLVGSSGSSNLCVQYSLGHGNGHNLANDHGIYMEGPNGVIRGNVLRYTGGGWGIQAYSGYTNTTITGYTIYDNLTYSNYEGGLVIWSCDGQVANGLSTNGVNLATQIGTNWLCNNTLLDGLNCRFGQLWLTNNLILSNPGYSAPIINGTSGKQATLSGDYNLGTNAILSSAHEVVTNWAGLGFKNPSTGLYWLTSSSAARGAATGSIVVPVDFFGNANPTIVDAGAFQYLAALAADTRVLDPMGYTAALSYWGAPVGPVGTPFTSTQ